MLTRGQAHVLTIVLIAFSMSGVMSLAMVIVNTGVGGDVVARWIRSWIIAFLIAMPTAAVLIPAVKRFVGRFTR